MNHELTDDHIRAAFLARASGSPSPDLADRIHAAAASTKQERPFIALPGLGRFAPVRHLALAAALGATVLVVAGSLFFGTGTRPDNGPIVGPSTPPSATPSTPPSLTPGYIFTPDSVVKVSESGPRHLPARDRGQRQDRRGPARDVGLHRRGSDRGRRRRLVPGQAVQDVRPRAGRVPARLGPGGGRRRPARPGADRPWNASPATRCRRRTSWT